MDITDFEFIWKPLPILKFPDPFLKTKTQPVTRFDGELRELVHRMLVSMYYEPGCGLSANQVGMNQRLFVMDVEYRRDKEKRYLDLRPQVFINPRIKSLTGKQLCDEGCLSFPGLVVQVERATELVMEFEDLQGETMEVAAADFLAICLQHEFDHLEGITFLDRLSRLKRQMATAKYLKQAR